MDPFQRKESAAQSVEVSEEQINRSGNYLGANFLGDLKNTSQHQASPPHKTAIDNNGDPLKGSISSAIALMLENSQFDQTELKGELECVFNELMEVYESAGIPASLRSRRYICETGLVFSPNQSTETIKDSWRIKAFVRGIDQAIRALNRSVKGKVNIVYPACGPFAPLLLPLLSYYQNKGVYSGDDIGVSLIDIQEGATQSLKVLIKRLKLEDFITEVVCCNAVSYNSYEPVHLVILEALQNGFSREGHLKLAKHFADMLEPIGIFLPKEISVNAVLNAGQLEYGDTETPPETGNEQHNKCIQNLNGERVELGEILRVNLPMLRKMSFQRKDDYTELYECGTVELPYLNKNYDRQVLMVSSKINVFNDEKICENDSDITVPVPDFRVCVNFVPKESKKDELLVSSGDKIKFYYCMNGLPGFLPVRLVEAET